MARGGARPGAGRKKGSQTKKTRKIAEAARDKGITPLEYLLEVLRDENNGLVTRLDAAKAAAPYMHARLTATTLDARGSFSVMVVATGLDD